MKTKTAKGKDSARVAVSAGRSGEGLPTQWARAHQRWSDSDRAIGEVRNGEYGVDKWIRQPRSKHLVCRIGRQDHVNVAIYREDTAAQKIRAASVEREQVKVHVPTLLDCRGWCSPRKPQCSDVEVGGCQHAILGGPASRTPVLACAVVQLGSSSPIFSLCLSLSSLLINQHPS